MYNSRPRKMNYGGYSSSFAVPENYSGNAFFGGEEEEEKITAEQTHSVEATNTAPFEDTAQAVKLVKESERCEPPSNRRTGFGFDLGNLFGGRIGFEELLIIGLIFLIAQKENNEDIIVLLALLLFIG